MTFLEKSNDQFRGSACKVKKNTDQYSFDNDYLCNAELSSLSPGIELMDRQRTFFARATSSKLTAV